MDIQWKSDGFGTESVKWRDSTILWKSRINWADHPSHKIHDAIVAYYAPKIKRAMAQSVEGVDKAISLAHSSFTKAKASDPARNVAHTAVQSGVTIASGDVEQILRHMAADSAAAAAHATAAELKLSRGLAEELSSVDWSTWEPGWAEAADLARYGGMADMLDAADATIRGMDENTINWLGDVLARGLDSGDPVDSIASAMNAVVDNADRSYLIATTETSRAMSEATIDTYAANDIAQWEWLSEQDDRVCDICLDKDGEVYDVGGDDPRPPEHPRCRCIVLPIIEEPSPDEIDAASQDSLDTSTDDTSDEAE